MAGKTKAYIGPFVTFVAFTGLCEALERAHLMPGGLETRYVIYPLQTLTCALLLAGFWRHYHLRLPEKNAWLGVAIGILAFAVWISPQAVFHHAPRTGGFDPRVLSGRPALYWAELVLRMVRLIVVVPALEEIFWRGFLMRYLINEEFDAVPFGTYARMANAFVAIGFMLEHSWPDYPAALLTGLAYNFVAYRTRSLWACIAAHAITNGLLGWYILSTGQWGFW